MQTRVRSVWIAVIRWFRFVGRNAYEDRSGDRVPDHLGAAEDVFSAGRINQGLLDQPLLKVGLSSPARATRLPLPPLRKVAGIAKECALGDTPCISPFA